MACSSPCFAARLVAPRWRTLWHSTNVPRRAARRTSIAGDQQHDNERTDPPIPPRRRRRACAAVTDRPRRAARRPSTSPPPRRRAASRSTPRRRWPRRRRSRVRSRRNTASPVELFRTGGVQVLRRFMMEQDAEPAGRRRAGVVRPLRGPRPHGQGQLRAVQAGRLRQGAGGVQRAERPLCGPAREHHLDLRAHRPRPAGRRCRRPGPICSIRSSRARW